MLVPQEDEDEQLALELEPSLPRVALSEFRGGNQLPIWDIAEKNFQIKKERPLVPLLLEYWSDNGSADLLIKVGTEQLRVNRLRFMCHSSYAMDEVKGGQRELELPEGRLTIRGVELVWDWIRKPLPQLERHQIVCALAAAKFLGIDALVKQIWYCLDLGADFSEDQAFAVSHDALQLTDCLPLAGVDTTMLHRIQLFFLTLVASREFVELPVRHVSCLLSSENVAVNSEQEIFFAAVRWLKHDWPARAPHVPQIMEAVRLMLLPLELIIDLQSAAVEPALREIAEQPDFRKIICEAYSAHTLMVFNDGTDLFAQLYDIFHIVVPMQRPFVSDPTCPYHAQHPREKSRHFNYTQFLSYLHSLQVGDVYSWRNLKVQYRETPSWPAEQNSATGK